MTQEVFLVGDVGGTQMRIGVAGADRIVDLETVRTPERADEFFGALAYLVGRMVDDYSVEAGAIGFPGPVRYEDDHKIVGPFANIAGIREPFDLGEKLAEADIKLKGLEILPLNDAEAATHAAPALAEEHAEEEPGLVTYITHSTGVGGDSIMDGKICSRQAGELAEYGHVPLQQADGSYSTLEGRISGTAIQNLYGQGIYSAEVLADAPYTNIIWENVGRDFGRGLALLAPIFGMTDIVIGGSVSKAHNRYGRALEAELEKAVAVIPDHVVDEAPNIIYVPTDMVDTLGLLGAYYAASNRDS